MTDIKSLLKEFFTTGIFFYAISLLFRYGYNNHFGVRYELINPDISDTILIFFAIFRGVTATFVTIISFIILFGIVSYIYEKNTFLKVLVVLGILLGAYCFGGFIANRSENIQIITGECIEQDEEIQYQVIDVFNDNVILKELNTESKGVLVRDIKTLYCSI